jgi:hypothetical protein
MTAATGRFALLPSGRERPYVIVNGSRLPDP